MTVDRRRALGDFQILREIGRGGMGIVYEAIQLSLGRRVVFEHQHGIVVHGSTVIGDDCIIGAGSIVSTDIPSGSLAVGNPARVAGSSADYLERQRALMARSPAFDARYTLGGGVTPAMKDEMNRQMQDGPAFID